MTEPLDQTANVHLLRELDAQDAHGPDRLAPPPRTERSRRPSHERRYAPLWELTISRWREFARERGAVLWVLCFPMVMTAAIGLAFRERPPERVRVLVDQRAPAWLSKALSSERTTVRALSPVDAEAALRRNDSDLFVSVHDGVVEYRYDASNQTARNAKLIVDDQVQRQLGRREVVGTRELTDTPRGSRYIDFLIPGILGMNVMSSTLWGIGGPVALARRRGLLKRLSASPMRRWQYLASYLLWRLSFLVVEIPALLLFGHFAFGFDVSSALAPVFALCALGALTFGGIALLIAARVQSVEATNTMLNLLNIAQLMLGGAFFSYERFPEGLQTVLRLLPLAALNDGLRMLCNEGLTLFALGPQLAVLALWGLLSFTLAVRVFRWQ